MNRPKLLIVDDNILSVEILKLALKDKYEIFSVPNGEEALIKVKSYRPDLILLDIIMPEMDGYEVLTALKKDVGTCDIPVIFITAKTDADNETRALSAGAVDFIHKPINEETALARVRLHLDLAQHRTQLRDINQRLEQSLEEIQQAKTRLEVLSTAIEQSPTSVVITGANALIQYINPRFSQESGYSPAEVIGQNPRILNSGLTDPAIFSDLWSHLKHGETWSGEFINRRKSGDIYCEEAHIAPVKDIDGNTTHYVGVKLDITGRKQAQEELTSKNAMLEREKSLAHGLLKTILAEKLRIQGFRTAVFFKPSDQIGGDFFDGWSDGNYAHFLVGDISGHSISAALLMAVCKGLFMTLGKNLNDPAEIVTTANRTLSKILTDSGMYLTMVYAVCDVHGRVLRVVSAGHNPAYLYSALAGRVPIESTGPPLGWGQDDSWTVTECPFVPGDKFLIYTDGVIEARNSSGEYGNSDIFAAVDATFEEEALVRKVLTSAETFCSGVFDDDVTLFAIGYDPAARSQGIT